MSVPVRRDGWTTAERRAVRRARRQIGLLAGLVIAGLVALVGGVSYAILVHGQTVQIRRELHWNAQHGEPSGPPGCTWLILRSGGTLDTGGTPPPAGFPLHAAIDAVAASGRAQEVTVTRNGTVYVVLTERRGADIVQAVFDTRYQLADRRLLLRALGIAESIGLLTALLTGLLVGGRAVAPLADALSRQRRFVADASHELRTPIARVHTRAQLMARRPALPPEQRTDLDRLIGNTRLLGEIVDDLLLSARLGADDRPAPASRIDLAALVRDAVAQDTDRAAVHGVTLIADGVAAPLAVPGIPSALRRVVSELIGNALSHTPPGGTVRVRATASGGTAVLEVADSGQGLDPADTERLFHRFHRGRSTRPGFGIGLALVREVVEKHGGTITASGRPGQGATFTIRLPLPR